MGTKLTLFNLKVSIKYCIKYYYNLIFKRNNNTVLDEKNVNFFRKRSVIEIIKYRNKRLVRKTFNFNDEGILSFQNEKKSIELFRDYDWFPKVINIQPQIIDYEYIDNKYRLDQISSLLSKTEKLMILEKILNIILIIFSKNIAHRDIHMKNIFYTGQNLYLIDFEVISSLDKKVDFFDSYDITGSGIDSPYLSGNMSLMNNSNVSLRHLIGFQNKDFLKDILLKSINSQIIAQSSSFKSTSIKNNRHFLKKKQAYSTFNLKYTTIPIDSAQRDTKKRITQHMVSRKEIENKSVLDLGSHLGAYSFEILKYKPKLIVGLEFDKEKVELAKIIHALNCKTSNLSFMKMDFESEYFINEFNYEFDVIISLSVIGHLSDPKSFLTKIYSICKELLIIEVNANISIISIEEMFRQVGFSKFNFIGFSHDENNESTNNNRSIFKVYK